MIVYSVSISIDREIVEDWINWMRQVHIPDVLNSGCFRSHQLLRRQSAEPQSNAQFVIQYFCDSQELLDQYWRDFAPALQSDHSSRYRGMFQAQRDVYALLED